MALTPQARETCTRLFGSETRLMISDETKRLLVPGRRALPTRGGPGPAGIGVGRSATAQGDETPRAAPVTTPI